MTRGQRLLPLRLVMKDASVLKLYEQTAYSKGNEAPPVLMRAVNLSRTYDDKARMVVAHG